jgi:hypothetical protein
MLIVVDWRTPFEAKQKLRALGEVMEFKTSGICYEAIAGHPDIFFFQYPHGIIMAPNTPEEYKAKLAQHGIKASEGGLAVGKSYPQTAHYNALHTAFGLLHNPLYSDLSLTKIGLPVIECKQGYVRCTTLQVGKFFFTSDAGIKNVLCRLTPHVLFTDPQNIKLTGFKNGFLGGAAGIYRNKVYICGNTRYLLNAKEFIAVINDEGYEVVELYDGPIIDIGGIFFME